MCVLLYCSHLVTGLGLAVLGSTCPSSCAGVTNLSAAPPSHHEHMRGPTGLTNLATLSCMCNASKPPPRWPMSSDVPTSPDLPAADNPLGWLRSCVWGLLQMSGTPSSRNPLKPTTLVACTAPRTAPEAQASLHGAITGTCAERRPFTAGALPAAQEGLAA